MQFIHIFRSFASGGALAGAVACLVQVPGVWDQQDAALAIKAGSRRDEMQNFVVVVDAGHGGDDGGTRGGGIQEKDGTLDIAKRVEAALRKRGVRVRMTREDDHYLSLPERCEIANGSRADAFVSIHLNAAPGSDAAGIETYFSTRQKLSTPQELRSKLGLGPDAEVRDERSVLLAGFIQKRVVRIGDTNDRGSRDSGFYVVRNTHCPSVLVECGYLTSAEEAGHLKNERHRNRIADVIADGVCQFLVATRFNPIRGIHLGEGALPVLSAELPDAPD